jgi:hypothetical protein
MQQTVRCPNCGSPNSPGQKFCGFCGGPMGVSCPNCGAALDSNDRFCGNCGAQMPAQGQPPQQPPRSPYTQQPRGQQQWSTQQQWTPPPQPGMYGPPQGSTPYQGAYGAAAPKKQSSMPLVVLLVVLILALGGFAYWAFLGSPPWSSGTGTSSIIKTGPFIQATSDNTSSTRDITITWETTADTTGKVDYGADESYGSSSQYESSATRMHSVPLTGLAPETRYHYRVVNKYNNNEVQSNDYTFTTPK